MGKLSESILADLKGKGGPPSPMKAGGGRPVSFGGKKPGNAAEDAADGGADDAEESDGGEYAGDEESIAGDIADAIKGGDNAALAEGLRSFIEACYPQLAKG